MPEQQYQQQRRNGYENGEASTHTDPSYRNGGFANNGPIRHRLPVTSLNPALTPEQDNPVAMPFRWPILRGFPLSSSQTTRGGHHYPPSPQNTASYQHANVFRVSHWLSSSVIVRIGVFRGEEIATPRAGAREGPYRGGIFPACFYRASEGACHPVPSLPMIPRDRNLEALP